MKASATLNWRPLLRASYAFFIGIAALWAMPRNAAAQLYVTQSTLPGEELGGVSEYDANTGVVMRASFIRRELIFSRAASVASGSISKWTRLSSR